MNWLRAKGAKFFIKIAAYLAAFGALLFGIAYFTTDIPDPNE